MRRGSLIQYLGWQLPQFQVHNLLHVLADPGKANSTTGIGQSSGRGMEDKTDKACLSNCVYRNKIPAAWTILKSEMDQEGHHFGLRITEVSIEA